ncbi:hypothetical protein [Flavilitoribacter nigricans]|uniref:Uncharacterized protein n=1 Tax=Flavilitoribacter nigricans (strain ATCC 23147 / DSM 23189 / NBRC 102662 / NCIMB 1420 / SS-2) TaxID=1122177 RepID=A0A2D0ND95_FLAN2|nr:hypothetical protein [Flavilitoribacter nigricans]PHN06378.1 hypothetical protein CRP01_12475 [Flavilitoribacter nigricans DSM 23189 = NBRC 102662]
MRIIGYIEHPELKITIFKMDTRISVKFEKGYLEQTFKFRQANGLEGAKEIRQLVDAKFLGQVEDQFSQMEALHEAAITTHFPPEPADEFDDII